MEKIKGKVKEIIKESSNVISLKISSDKFDFRPNQFVMVSFERLNESTGKNIERAFSISSSPTEEEIMLTIKLHEEGIMTNFIFKEIKPGETIDIRGPFGNFIFEENFKDIVLIVAGSGIAPVRGIMKYIEDKGLNTKVTLFATFRREEDIIYKSYLNELKGLDNFSINISLTRPDENWKGMTGRINFKTIEEKGAVSKEKVYFICGPRDMVSSMKKELEERKVFKVITEAW